MNYEIRTINDLLKVPADRRDACWKDITLALAAVEFAIGSENTELEILTWTDDDDPSVTVVDQNGVNLFALKVTKDGK